MMRQIRNNLPIFLTVSIMTALILIVIVCFIYIKTMGRKARQTKKEKDFSHHDNYMINYSDVSNSSASPPGVTFETCIWFLRSILFRRTLHRRRNVAKRVTVHRLAAITKSNKVHPNRIIRCHRPCQTTHSCKLSATMLAAFHTKSPLHTGLYQSMLPPSARMFQFFFFAFSFESIDGRLTTATTKPITHQRIYKIRTVQSLQSKIGNYLSNRNIDATNIHSFWITFLLSFFFFFVAYLPIPRRSMDYDDDRYYIANNIRNSQYAMNPNPSPNYVQKPISPTTATANYPSAANRYVSHPKHATIPLTSPTVVDPRQDVGLPRSSIV